MRKINLKKFINIPWTETNPQNRENYFHVHTLMHQRGGLITAVRMQAVVSGPIYCTKLEDLGNTGIWLRGWC